jgi:histidinol-phosphatase
MTDLASDLALALTLADTADRITLDRAGAADLRVDRKPDRTPVTDADLAVEDAIRTVLQEQRPQDLVLGEERGGPSRAGAVHDARRIWLLDPIDGTKNFLRGVPVWATLVALVERGRPVVGVISAPALRRRWWAAAGAGAHAYISTTHLGSWAAHRRRESYLSLVDATWENRAFGDFWQHCLVAEGAIDVAAEPVVSPWDVAAAQVLVEQAGGRFTDLRGVDRYDGGTALSSNGLLHDAALTLLQ